MIIVVTAHPNKGEPSVRECPRAIFLWIGCQDAATTTGSSQLGRRTPAETRPPTIQNIRSATRSPKSTFFNYIETVSTHLEAILLLFLAIAIFCCAAAAWTRGSLCPPLYPSGKIAAIAAKKLCRRHRKKVARRRQQSYDFAPSLTWTFMDSKRPQLKNFHPTTILSIF